MNNNKMRTCLEIVYNCPFLLLVFSTSFLFFIYSGVSTERDDDKNIAVVQMDVAGEMPEDHGYTDDENNEKLDELEQNIDNEVSAEQTDQSQRNEEELENAGTRKEENADIENETERKTDVVKPKGTVVKREEKERATKFVEYTPIFTDSIYYSDAGKVALTTTYD
ncbi:MAG: hypothetical protein K2N37_00525, partial [Lachnospiraceae bacterium]|nr:hypothetical protein [Lachnospiraceae bacterium]